MMIKEIPLADLLLDLENPRHNILGNQQEAIKVMVEALGEKIVNLAEHIVQHGLSPGEIPIVIPSEEHEGRFVVAEGNRRLTALKLLETPKLAQGLLKGRKWDRLVAAARAFAAKPIHQVPVAICQDKASAAMWIQLRHTGENKGVGIVEWGTTEQARFSERRGKKTPALQILDLVRNDPKVSEQDKNRYAGVALTNLDRLIKDPNVRDAIGISLAGDQVGLLYPEPEVRKPLRKIMDDLTKGDFNVNNIRHKEDRAQYLAKFKKTDLPRGEKLKIPISPGGEDAKDLAPPKERKKPTSPAGPRRTFIPRGFLVSVSEPRPQEIFKELQTLDLETYRNAVSVLIRVFVEMSVDAFYQRKGLTVHPNERLHKRVKAAAKWMEKNKVMSERELKPVFVATGSQNHPVSVDTFHAYVHHGGFHPSPQDLRHVWDNLGGFIKNLWEA